MKPTSLSLRLTAFLLALLATGCAERRLGWAVVLWSDVEAFDNGQLFSVASQSEVADTYTMVRGDRKMDVARWRARFFETEQAALEFRDAYAGLVDQYGYAQRQGLPIRVSDDANATTIYRLREGELVKLISRSTLQVTVSTLTNYWYQVLTSNGTLGYTFGEYLPVFATDGDPETEVARLLALDPVFARILSAAWRPEYFLGMLIDQRIDLQRFRTEYGLFANHETQTLQVVTEDITQEFSYASLQRVGNDVYLLGDNQARLQLQNQNRVALSFSPGSRLITKVFVQLARSAKEVIATERDRRAARYGELLERGTTLSSDAYGSITLGEEGSFTWTGLGNLVPAVLPAGTLGQGEVDFPLHLDGAISSAYDGVITFQFTAGARLDFLYAFEPSGIRLVHVRDPDLQRLLVSAAPPTPLNLYFTFSE